MIHDRVLKFYNYYVSSERSESNIFGGILSLSNFILRAEKTQRCPLKFYNYCLISERNEAMFFWPFYFVHFYAKKVLLSNLRGGQLVHRCMYPLLFALKKYYIIVICLKMIYYI